MTALAKFVGTPLSAAIGWTLLHSIWEGALIAALLAAVLAFTRSSRVRYAAACIAMISMLCGFALTIANLLPEQGTELPSLRMQSHLLDHRSGRPRFQRVDTESAKYRPLAGSVLDLRRVARLRPALDELVCRAETSNARRLFRFR